MAALTKANLVRSIAEELGFPQSQAAELVEQVIGLIKDTLISGEDVLVSGFGKFCVRSKRARRGRNPANGESMMLKPRKVVTFKWSGRLRDRLNQ